MYPMHGFRMRHKHHAEQWLPYPIETVFDFFSNPENLPRLMPEWQHARITSSNLAPAPPRPDGSVAPATVAAGKGTRLTITFQAIPFLPIRLPWDAEITEFVWNDHFCDIQLARGPFAYWRHCHRLEVLNRSGIPGTLVRDQVEYELRLGVLGELANKLFVGRQIYEIFVYRQRRTTELLAHT